MKKILLFLLLFILVGCSNSQNKVNLYDYNYGISTYFTINRNIFDLKEEDTFQYEKIILTENVNNYKVEITYKILSNSDYLNLRNELSNVSDVMYSNFSGYKTVDLEYNTCSIYLKLLTVEGEVYLLDIKVNPTDYNGEINIENILNLEDFKLILDSIELEK